MKRLPVVVIVAAVGLVLPAVGAAQQIRSARASEPVIRRHSRRRRNSTTGGPDPTLSPTFAAGTAADPS